jgi:hypothetical protein
MTKKNNPAISTRRISQRRIEPQRNTLNIWLIVGGVALVLLVVALFYLGYQGQTLTSSGIEGAETFPDPGRGHQDGDLQYAQLVPVGGVHNPQWLNCGIYDEPVRRENAIHSMEHGAVWLAYRPDLPAEQVDYLRNIVRNERAELGENLILLAPLPDLDVPLVATAWRAQLKLDDVYDERLQLFLDRYQRGPYYPEPGASCTFGGIGEPLS